VHRTSSSSHTVLSLSLSLSPSPALSLSLSHHHHYYYHDHYHYYYHYHYHYTFINLSHTFGASNFVIISQSAPLHSAQVTTLIYHITQLIIVIVVIILLLLLLLLLLHMCCCSCCSGCAVNVLCARARVVERGVGVCGYMCVRCVYVCVTYQPCTWCNGST
jgi:hypothetical protein